MVYTNSIKVYNKQYTYTEHAKRKTVTGMDVVRLLHTSIIQNGPYKGHGKRVYPQGRWGACWSAGPIHENNR